VAAERRDEGQVALSGKKLLSGLERSDRIERCASTEVVDTQRALLVTLFWLILLCAPLRPLW
jgi:membrane protein required for beta-lactamase induction